MCRYVHVLLVCDCMYHIPVICNTYWCTACALAVQFSLLATQGQGSGRKSGAQESVFHIFSISTNFPDLGPRSSFRHVCLDLGLGFAMGTREMPCASRGREGGERETLCACSQVGTAIAVTAPPAVLREYLSDRWLGDARAARGGPAPSLAGAGRRPAAAAVGAASGRLRRTRSGPARLLKTWREGRCNAAVPETHRGPPNWRSVGCAAQADSDGLG